MYKSDTKPPRRPSAPAVSPTEVSPGAVFGRNAVTELLRSGRSVDRVYVKEGEREGSLTVICAEALARKIPLLTAGRTKLDAMSGGQAHQGVVAFAAEADYRTVDDILEIAKNKGEKPFLVIADGICDPHNLGAVIRSAECAGAHGLIIAKRREVGLTAVVAKTSAGALSYLPVARVANIAATVDTLKEKGMWIYGAEAGGQDYRGCEMNGAVALVLGSEGEGISPLVRSKCDFIVSLPMYGKITSLNVSAAAAVLLYKAAADRRPFGKDGETAKK